MHLAQLEPTPKLLLLLFLASATFARAQEIRWPIQSTAPPPIIQGYAEFGDVSKAKYHTGLDLGVPSGTPIFPVAAGEVVLIQLLSGTSDHGFGRTVIMRHSGTGPVGVYSQYSHLSEIDAKLIEACKPKREVDDVTLTCAAGVTLTTEDGIGKSGRSGFGMQEYPKYGEHLHVEIKAFGTLCTSDTAGPVCGYSTAHPSTVGYLDPIERLFFVQPFPKPVPVIVIATGVSVRFTPDAGQGKRAITKLDSTSTVVPLRGTAWARGYGACDEEWIRVRRVDDPNCSAASGASACFQDTLDPDPALKPPAKYLGLVPTAWICAKYLSPLKVPTAREAVTEGVLFTGGSVKVKRAGVQGLEVELGDRDGLFSVYQMAQLGPSAVTDLWGLIFLEMVNEEPPYKAFAATHQDLVTALLARYGAACAGTQTLNAQAACAVAGLAKSRGIRMGGGRYDEGQRCVGWRDRPNGAFECRPY